MLSTGEQLRQARENRGQTLAEIAESTKIGRRYLEAIERDEPDDLPGEVFVKGYIRTFAAEVGLNGDRLVESYQQEREERGNPDGGDDAVVQEMSRLLEGSGSRSGRGAVIAIVAVIGVGLIAFGAWSFWPEIERDGEVAPKVTTTDPGPKPPVETAVVERPTESRPTVAVRPDPAPEPPPVALPVRPEPQPEPKRKPAPQTRTEVADGIDSSITIPDHGVGTAVVNRQLVGGGERFEAGTTVWFWTRIVGADAGERVNHVWLHEGRVAGAVELKVGGMHWRTQSRRQLPEGATGHWVVEARDAAGRVLARDEFTVVAPS